VADLVTVPSVATQTDVLRFVPELSEERVRVIAHGVGEEFKLYPPDEIERSVRRLRLPASYILYVGTIEPRKNISTLVESYRRLVVSEGISEHLLLVGQLGWKYKQVLKKLNAQELRGRVHQIGYMPQEDLPWIYAGARLFVYPSVHEGFGFPPLEAMACGVPTISSLSSSMTENLHGAAELFPPDNVEALTEAIRRLLYDEWARKDLRQKGLVRAATYCWDETARKTVQCYRAAIR